MTANSNYKMGKTQKHYPVKLVCGFIYASETEYKRACARLIKRFGRIDFESQRLDFKYSDYYRKEFGDNLSRKFISFKKLTTPDKLAKIKTITNSIETKLSRRGQRAVNIDPGYITLAKLVLATTKDYQHRIYLGLGIYAEVTLVYQNKTYCRCPWTYPDYQSSDYIAVFNRIRSNYVLGL